MARCGPVEDSETGETHHFCLRNDLDVSRRAAAPRSDLALPTIRAAKHIMESYFPATSEALGLSPKKKKPEPEPEPEKSAVTAYVLKLKEVVKNAYEKRTRREVIYAFAFALPALFAGLAAHWYATGGFAAFAADEEVAQKANAVARLLSRLNPFNKAAVP